MTCLCSYLTAEDERFSVKVAEPNVPLLSGVVVVHLCSKHGRAWMKALRKLKEESMVPATATKT